MNDPAQTKDTGVPLTILPSESPGGNAPVPFSSTLPERIGRYRVVKLLGEGGFGRVFQALDEQLNRPVAIKTPHPRLIARPEDVEAYLAEARILASLDHPHIVPVHDVGRTEDGLCFVVSKLIDGSDLARHLKETRLSFAETGGLAATVAEALHYAHKKGLVHRDVKPANILVDGDGKPHVADFGLALRDEDFGNAAKFAGTPAYMSPEQARGEGHRVDGRSDIFSLGVILYEMLTGRRPFRAGSVSELLEQIANLEPRPPRQIDENVPGELERICLKALAKRATERYLTAKDLADDLRHFLGHAHEAELSALSAGLAGEAAPTPTPQARPAPKPTSDRRPVRIVPKGLRSFDAHDADFFLELLPGPRDRDGLPDSIRFWKTRIEQADADSTFAVGLLYGPSGCGKSSLVKAGLLPRLAGNVQPVCVEATADETEARLLNGLRKRYPGLPAGLGVQETLAALRRGQGVPSGQKILIVLDQFEQWLHARREEENTHLVQALRQCDGACVQCVVMVRDDFWMAATRFMHALEVRLVEGQNSAAVDLFPMRHAEKVLAAFGRAFGVLPESEISKEQKEFLGQAVAGLAEDGKVVSVRLALFAEMMKSRPWTPAALREVGGAQGIGAAFLEETFSAATAPPEHRYHQKAARAVLKTLLPEAGSDIKGHMRSHVELLVASGYSGRHRDFHALISILDSEVRLITPTDPEGVMGEPGASATGGSLTPVADAPGSPGRFYQLTHDYLVPSLRDWLTRKQRETRRGRAELRLAERAALWSVKPENRFLPAWWEWLNIRMLTRKRDWTAPQKRMMRKATRYHTARGLALATCMLLLLWGSWEGFGRLQAQRLHDRLLEAATEDVPNVVNNMKPYRRWLNDSLREAYTSAESDGDARKQMHASLALLPVDAGQVDYLQRRLLTGTPQEVLVLREALHVHSSDLTEQLWQVVEDSRQEPGQRLRAACALALYTPVDARWETAAGGVVDAMQADKVRIGQWADAIAPAGKFLLPALATLLLREERSAVDRNTLAVLYQGYARETRDGFALLENVLAQPNARAARLEDRLALARRQANAAVALAAMGRWEKVSPLLRHSEDPTLRSYLIDRLGPGGVEAPALMARLEEEQNLSVRRALLLSLGELGLDRLPDLQRELLIPRLMEIYQDDPDSGMHGASGWLLRKWGQQKKLAEIDQILAVRDRDVATRGVHATSGRRWYVNEQKQTMVIVPRPGVFWMGEGKERHRRRIDRTLALSAREVTVAEFRLSGIKHEHDEKYGPTTVECPVNGVSWFDAAAYCNWLSKAERIPKEQWCYVEDEKGIRPEADFLKRTGYRLPTEAEWEYACRSGSSTPWSHGEEEDLLARYAWYITNSGSKTHPVGSLRPNDLGLVDMQGNVWEWCQDRDRVQEREGNKIREDIDDKEDIKYTDSSRLLRGGSFRHDAVLVRSAYRDIHRPADRYNDYGFRPARTFR